MSEEIIGDLFDKAKEKVLKSYEEIVSEIKSKVNRAKEEALRKLGA